MNRVKILSRIHGPIESGSFSTWYDPEWVFYVARDIKHAGGPVTARKFTLVYDRKARRFSAVGTRRVSKRKKRVPVKVSRGMIQELRRRLPNAVLAQCLASSIAA